MRRLFIALVVLLVSGCGDYKPAPGVPLPGQAGKKHCTDAADCVSHMCGADGFCQ